MENKKAEIIEKINNFGIKIKNGITNSGIAKKIAAGTLTLAILGGALTGCAAQARKENKVAQADNTAIIQVMEDEIDTVSNELNQMNVEDKSVKEADAELKEYRTQLRTLKRETENVVNSQEANEYLKETSEKVGDIAVKNNVVLPIQDVDAFWNEFNIGERFDYFNGFHQVENAISSIDKLLANGENSNLQEQKDKLVNVQCKLLAMYVKSKLPDDTKPIVINTESYQYNVLESVQDSQKEEYNSTRILSTNGEGSLIQSEEFNDRITDYNNCEIKNEQGSCISKMDFNNLSATGVLVYDSPNEEYGGIRTASLAGQSELQWSVNNLMLSFVAFVNQSLSGTADIEYDGVTKTFKAVDDQGRVVLTCNVDGHGCLINTCEYRQNDNDYQYTQSYYIDEDEDGKIYDMMNNQFEESLKLAEQKEQTNNNEIEK